jgi:hypothetical protein
MNIDGITFVINLPEPRAALKYVIPDEIAKLFLGGSFAIGAENLFARFKNDFSPKISVAEDSATSAFKHLFLSQGSLND